MILSYLTNFKRLCSTIPDKQLIMILRRETGAPFSICREALINAKNQKNEAREYIARALSERFSKISQRPHSLSNGLVCVGHNLNTCALVKMNCETDFVAKTDEFLNISGKALECFLSVYEKEDIDEFKHQIFTEKVEILKLIDEFHLERHMNETSGKLGEKLEIGFVSLITFPDRLFPGIYAHSSEGLSHLGLPFPNSFGRVGSIVLLESGVDNHDYDFSRDIAKQITGFNPFENQEVKNYPKALSVLMEQLFLGDSTTTVQKYLSDNSMRIIIFDREEHYT